MKRLRLLIYEGEPKWIAMTRVNEAIKGTWQPSSNGQITSIELNPLRMTVLELLRVLFKREGK